MFFFFKVEKKSSEIIHSTLNGATGEIASCFLFNLCTLKTMDVSARFTLCQLEWVGGNWILLLDFGGFEKFVSKLDFGLHRIGSKS